MRTRCRYQHMLHGIFNILPRGTLRAVFPKEKWPTVFYSAISKSYQQVKNVYDQKLNSPGMANSSQLFLRYVKCQCNHGLCVNVWSDDSLDSCHWKDWSAYQEVTGSVQSMTTSTYLDVTLMLRKRDFVVYIANIDYYYNLLYGLIILLYYTFMYLMYLDPRTLLCCMLWLLLWGKLKCLISKPLPAA